MAVDWTEEQLTKFRKEQAELVRREHESSTEGRLERIERKVDQLLDLINLLHREKSYDR